MSYDPVSNVTRLVAYAVIALALVLFLRGLFDFSYFLDNPTRLGVPGWPDWGQPETSTVPKTQHEFRLIAVGSSIVFGLVIFNIRKGMGLLIIILSGMAITLGLLARGRMTLGSTVVAGIIVLLAYVWEKKLYRKKAFSAISVLAVLTIVLLVFTIRANYFGLGDWYKGSNLADEGGFFRNVRFQLMGESIENLRRYPFGNTEVLLDANGKSFEYAHNSWLDIGRRGGVIPFVLTVGFTISNIVSLIILWKRDSDPYKYEIMAAFIGVTLYNMFEPAICAGHTIWSIEIFLGGMINGLCILSGKVKEITLKM